MSCCCTKTYKFCDPVNGCDNESFAALFAGVLDGSYIVKLDYLGSYLFIDATITDGVLTFTSIVPLNENFTYTGQLLDENEVIVPLIKGGIEYDCFQFRTENFVGQKVAGPSPSSQYLIDVVEGVGIQIDKSDPKRPIINALAVVGSVAWGAITGNLTDQTDLKSALDAKADKETGKSLIADSEILRLAGVFNYDDSGLISAINGKADANDSRINNGQTAFSWGNHASAGYLTGVNWGIITGLPTTLSGYGITDAYPLSGNPSGFLTAVPTNTTLQGNTFNGASQLLQLGSDGKYPPLDGSLITNLPGGFSLPSQTGNAGKVLQTDGTNVSWQSVSGGGGSPAGSTGQIQFNSGGAFAADSALFWDGNLNIGSSIVIDPIRKQIKIGTNPTTVVGIIMPSISNFIFSDTLTGSSPAATNIINNFNNYTGLLMRRVSSGSGNFIEGQDNGGATQFIINRFGNFNSNGSGNNYFLGAVTSKGKIIAGEGILPAQKTSTQKGMIVSPEKGLVIFDTTLNKLCVFTTTWETIQSI